jgi:flagellar basal-body rod protein FlgB
MIKDAKIDLLSRALNVSLERQNLTSANIANVDTPEFTPRGFDFAKELNSAQKRSGMSMSKSHAGHLTGKTSYTRVDADEMPDKDPGLDGNSVDLDVQIAQSARNSILYAASAKSVNKKLSMLRYAIEYAGKG